MIKQILIFSAVVIFSCSTPLKNSGADSEGADGTDNEDFEHSIKYSHKGTKSEAEHGYLKYKGKMIPDIFSVIITPKKSYKFSQRKFLWGKDGYFKANIGKSENFTVSDKTLSNEELSSGYYKGIKKMKGTPANWIFVRWKKGSAFVSPEKFFVLVKEFNPGTISRMTAIKMKK